MSWPSPDLEEVALAFAVHFEVGADGFRVLRELANKYPDTFADAASRMLTGESAVNALIALMVPIAGDVADPRAERRRQLYEARREWGKKGRAASSSRYGTPGGPAGPGRPHKRVKAV